MAANDKLLLDGLLDGRRRERAPDEKPDDYFEIFCAEEILKDLDLNDDEIASGLVGGGNDGGIDSAYLFLNDELLREKANISGIRGKPRIDLHVIQSKTSAGFSETAIDKLIVTTERVFDLESQRTVLERIFNDEVVALVEVFKHTYLGLVARLPALTIRYYYASKGDEVHPKVQEKVRQLTEVVRKKFSDVDFRFEFLGARHLLELARRTPTTSYQLKLAEIPIPAAKGVAYVCLVRLQDYFEFITSDSRVLLRHLFEANVRDYQGITQVNAQIQKTLRDAPTEDFWWLNNGVTVVASKATQAGKTLTIENPQVVNGLQTSTEIFNYLHANRDTTEDRTLLVRVIVPPDEDSWDRIIRATNSQTAVPQASLRATDRIHRDIEEYFKLRGLFYDRRKNYYKNLGKPISAIVSIPALAQSVMAILRQQPNVARGRPSSLLKSDDDYQQIFSESYPVHLYFVAADIMQRVDRHLRSPEIDLSRKERNNIQFHVAMYATALSLRKATPKPSDFSDFDANQIDDATLHTAYEAVFAIYTNLGANDRVSKGPKFAADVQEHLRLALRAVSEPDE